VNLEQAIKVICSIGDKCIFCDGKISAGERVVEGEYRVGGRVMGKTFRVESHPSCAGKFGELLSKRAKEALP